MVKFTVVKANLNNKCHQGKPLPQLCLQSIDSLLEESSLLALCEWATKTYPGPQIRLSCGPRAHQWPCPPLPPLQYRRCRCPSHLHPSHPSRAHWAYQHRRRVRGSSAHQLHQTWQHLPQIPVLPHAPQHTLRGTACNSVARDQALDAPFHPARTNGTRPVNNLKHKREKVNWLVAHLDKRHFQNLDSHAFMSVAPSSAEEPPPSSSGSPPKPASAPTPTPTPTPAHAYVPTLLGDKRTSFTRPGDASLRVTHVLDQHRRPCISAPLCTLSDRSHYHATIRSRVRRSTSLLWHYPAFDPHTHAYGAVDHTRTTRISSPPLSTLVVCDGSRCGRRGGVGGMRVSRCRCCPGWRGTLAVGYWVNRKSDWFPNGQGLRVGKMQVRLFVALLSPSGPH